MLAGLSPPPLFLKRDNNNTQAVFRYVDMGKDILVCPQLSQTIKASMHRQSIPPKSSQCGPY